MADVAWRQPAEWREHDACWLAWPSHPAEWPGELEGARQGVAEMAAALAGGERVEMLVLTGESEDTARRALEGVDVHYRSIPFGDIWLRDTGPVFTFGPEGQLGAARFRWTGWAGRHVFEHDDEVAPHIAAAAGAARFDFEMAAEGGALEPDGEGTVLTTRQCLLHPERNPGATERDLESVLGRAVGATTVLWLDHGLANDHTDGHIDTLARFVAPGRVAIMEPSGPADPNREVLDEIARDLSGMRDAAGRSLELVRVPSPGRVESSGGELLPASYLNFYIGNQAVVVPVYGAVDDQRAVEILAAQFPGRRTVAVDARSVVTAGGAYHCISQQQPRPPGQGGA